MSTFHDGQLVEVIGCDEDPLLNGMCGIVICRDDYYHDDDTIEEAYNVDFDHGVEYLAASILRPLPPFDFKLLQTTQKECSV